MSLSGPPWDISTVPLTLSSGRDEEGEVLLFNFKMTFKITSLVPLILLMKKLRHGSV